LLLLLLLLLLPGADHARVKSAHSDSTCTPDVDE